MVTFTSICANPEGFVVALDRDRGEGDWSDLIGQAVAVDGRVFRCIAVEKFMHTAPWRAGEHIGLITEPLPLAHPGPA